MHLHITPTEFIIQLEWHERLWAFHLGDSIRVPIHTIRNVSTDPPPMEWYALRAPGTAVPGLFTAGTYYANRGREFWYVTRRSDFLVVDIDEGYYKRIVLTINDHQTYAEQLRQAGAGHPAIQ
jgi:hypothetical protein